MWRRREESGAKVWRRKEWNLYSAIGIISEISHNYQHNGISPGQGIPGDSGAGEWWQEGEIEIRFFFVCSDWIILCCFADCRPFNTTKWASGFGIRGGQNFWGTSQIWQQQRTRTGFSHLIVNFDAESAHCFLYKIELKKKTLSNL